MNKYKIYFSEDWYIYVSADRVAISVSEKNLVFVFILKIEDKEENVAAFVAENICGYILEGTQ